MSRSPDAEFTRDLLGGACVVLGIPVFVVWQLGWTFGTGLFSGLWIAWLVARWPER